MAPGVQAARTRQPGFVEEQFERADGVVAAAIDRAKDGPAGIVVQPPRGAAMQAGVERRRSRHQPRRQFQQIAIEMVEQRLGRHHDRARRHRCPGRIEHAETESHQIADPLADRGVVEQEHLLYHAGQLADGSPGAAPGAEIADDVALGATMQGGKPAMPDFLAIGKETNDLTLPVHRDLTGFHRQRPYARRGALSWGCDGAGPPPVGRSKRGRGQRPAELSCCGCNCRRAFIPGASAPRPPMGSRAGSVPQPGEVKPGGATR